MNSRLSADRRKTRHLAHVRVTALLSVLDGRENGMGLANPSDLSFVQTALRSIRDVVGRAEFSVVREDVAAARPQQLFPAPPARRIRVRR